MLTRKSLVILAGLLIITALMILVSWSPATVTAQGPSPAATPQPPVAVLKVLAVPGNAADKNAITTTIKFISETAVGPANSTVAMYTKGGSNVPVKVPVVLQVSAADPKNSGKPTWSLTKPADSKAVITGTEVAKFTPDVVGAYMVSVSLRNEAGVASAPQFAFFNAGTYIGATAGNCKQCHAEEATEWAKTGHALVFEEELDNQVDGPLGVKPGAAGYITHYSETCTRCHTTGWYPAFSGTGGYFDAKAKANWTFPTWKQIDEVFTKKNPSNWEAAPAEVKNMGAIGCEVCHGPAEQHVKNGAKVMEASWDNGTCNQCHGAAANHSKGMQIAYSAHSDATAHAWEIAGPGEQNCVRCHTAKGYASFLKNPTNPAAWENEEQTLSCVGCHNPHSEEYPFQLRIVGKPVGLPFEVKRDVGLSATCYECHNARRNGDDFAAGKVTSYPHYSSAAELIENTGGVTYGQALANSPHGMMVGAAPMPNPAAKADDPSITKFLFTPNTSSKGNTPGACVACHMWAPITAANDPLQYKVGGHSFNTAAPDGKGIYAASCKSCHGDLKTFNIAAKADYDGNGKVEGVQDEVKGLLNVLWKGLEAKGVKRVETGNPYATIPADADQKVKNAWYNFRTVYGVMWGPETGNGNEGKGAAAHNFKRAVSLLQLSIKDLTGSLPSGASELK